MKKPILVLSLVSLLCFTFGCQKGEEVAEAPKVNVEADVAAIKASFNEFVQLYNAADFGKIMSNYAETSIQMPPNESVRKGKEAVLLGYQKTRELNDEHCDSSVVEDVRVSGDLAVVRGTDTGTTTPKSGGEPVKYNLKWLTVLERQTDGTWKWIYEMWNDNDPLPEKPEKE
jgi:ketosteroid isomerase-like protein